MIIYSLWTCNNPTGRNYITQIRKWTPWVCLCVCFSINCITKFIKYQVQMLLFSFRFFLLYISQFGFNIFPNEKWERNKFSSFWRCKHSDYDTYMYTRARAKLSLCCVVMFFLFARMFRITCTKLDDDGDDVTL